MSVPWHLVHLQLPGGSGKESACNAGDPVSIPGSRRSPGEGNGNALQYHGLENTMENGDWQATLHGVAESDVNERLTLAHFHSFTTLCNYHCHPPPMLCHRPKLKHNTPYTLSSPSLSPQPQTTTIQLSVCMNLTVVWQIMQYLSSSGWLILASSNVLNVRKLNVNVAGTQMRWIQNKKKMCLLTPVMLSHDMRY